MRRFIMRETPSRGDIARWINAMQEVAEGTRWSIPVLVAANSKNEQGGFAMGGTARDVPFTQVPGTLGLAASGDLDLISRFADQSRQERRASGLRKGYMYMADVVTDPRWFRTYGTFGERPELVAAAIDADTSSVMPYYAIPSKEKSTLPQPPLEEFEQVGFAFNREVLREMGHRGYINSDTGILSKMAWGVEELSTPERAGKAVSAGTDVIADTNDVGSIREAYVRGQFSAQRLDEAAAALLTEMLALILFEDPYVDPDEADRVVANAAFQEVADEAHRRSVVLLKNAEQGGQRVLPLRAEDLTGRRVHVDVFDKGLTVAALESLRAQLAEAHPELTFTTDPAFAEVAVLFVNPSTGDYFESTGLYDLSIHEATTVDLARIERIRGQVGTVVVALNVALSWIPASIEPLADALVAGFDTRRDVVFDAICGAFTPSGQLPLTLPAYEAAVAVDEDGICASPNDVPGYAKEQHMDGVPYVYADAAGNRYVSGFGLEGWGG